ncbi:hypothetical protein DL96DRAFT_114626 [Flagelloscypha sp. PMI_526]|nr:hypothetical protein DL96DRAFT_114626 [Flagelloscypha sp. PMI_526]
MNHWSSGWRNVIQNRLSRSERLLQDLGIQWDNQGRVVYLARDGMDEDSHEAETRKRVLLCEERVRIAEKDRDTALAKQQTTDTFASFTRLIQTGQGSLHLGPPPPSDHRHHSQQHRNSYPLPSQRPAQMPHPVSPTNRAVPMPLVQSQVMRTSQYNTAVPPRRDPYPHASYSDRAQSMQRRPTALVSLQKPTKEGSPDVDELLLATTALTPKRPLETPNGNERKRQKVFNGPEIDLTSAGHASSTFHHPLTPQHSASLPSTATPRGPPTTTPTPHQLPNGQTINVYPALDGSGKRICRQCGVPGRYKDGKCIEKWGPGPMGAGTVCDRCRKRMRRESGKGIERAESKLAPGLVGGQRDVFGKHDILHAPHHASTLPTSLPSRPPTGLEHHAPHPRADTLPAIALSSTHTTAQVRAGSSNPEISHESSSEDDADADADADGDPEVEHDIIRTLSPMPPLSNGSSGNGMLTTSPLPGPNRTLSPLPGMRTRTLSPHPYPPPDHMRSGTLMTTSPLPQPMLELPSTEGGKVVMSSPYAMTVDIGEDDEDEVFREAVDASEEKAKMQ